jgi:hypothetical protein
MSVILRIYVNIPFLMWGSAPRPRKPCKGLKKSFTKRTYSFLVQVLSLERKCGAACGSYKGL